MKLENMGYLESYAEIPDKYIEDPYLRAKKIAGHLRCFDPLQHEEVRTWFIVNYFDLCNAYGSEYVNAFMARRDIPIPQISSSPAF